MNQSKQGLIVLLVAIGALMGIGVAMWLGRNSPLGQQLSQSLSDDIGTLRKKAQAASRKSGAGNQDDSEAPLFI